MHDASPLRICHLLTHHTESTWTSTFDHTFVASLDAKRLEALHTLVVCFATSAKFIGSTAAPKLPDSVRTKTANEVLGKDSLERRTSTNTYDESIVVWVSLRAKANPAPPSHLPAFSLRRDFKILLENDEEKKWRKKTRKRSMRRKS